MIYRGRFAPTPSGPLHQGSLLTALASYLQARKAEGEWLLRIDDLDQARCRAEHIETIYRQLETHGLQWDATPRLQSQHIDEYERAYGQLLAADLLYGCSCTRAQLERTSIEGVDGPVYAGLCSDPSKKLFGNAARLRVADLELTIDDVCQGELRRSLEFEVGDFVVRRADGQIGYQLACVVDERAQGITEVVRGSDLIGSSFRQHYLRQALDLPQPRYAHLPLLLDSRGLKLSKQNHAASIDENSAADNLFASLVRLGQMPPAGLRTSNVAEILQWAVVHWEVGRIPTRASMVLPLGA